MIMKRAFFLIYLFLFTISIFASTNSVNITVVKDVETTFIDEEATQDIPINEENFPDANFRAFVADSNIDFNLDGFLSEEEIKKITALNIERKSINNLKGIEYFKSLNWLSCSYNRLSSLDLTGNPQLNLLRCSGNKLTSLDLSMNSFLEELDCSGNQLTKLEISRNTMLIGLNCSGNTLKNLDVSQNVELSNLNCEKNQLSSLNVTNNYKLKDLTCSFNQLKDLDLSNNVSLTGLFCKNNQLVILDFSKNTKLIYIECGYNRLNELHLKNNLLLETLLCNNNQLSSIDVSKNSVLHNLCCDNNKLKMLDISGCPSLWSVSCKGNMLSTLDVSKNTDLTELTIMDNHIKGEGMDALVNGLPIPKVTIAYLYVMDVSSTADERNICTKEQVAKAKEKGWNNVMASLGNFNYIDYQGSDPISTGIEDHAWYYRPQAVYSLSGQMVRSQAKNLKGLPAGIYIVGTKKVVVK